MSVVTLLGGALGFSWVYTAAVVAFAAFVYTRVRRSQQLDLGTGLTLYVAVITFLSALFVAVGLGFLLTVVIGSGFKEATYGTGVRLPAFLPGQIDFIAAYAGEPSRRTDAALAFGNLLAGLVALGTHRWLRQWLNEHGAVDSGAEAAVECFAALVVGFLALALTASALDEGFRRAIAEQDGLLPGAAVGFALAFLIVWGAYAYRSFWHLRQRLER